jgi:serine/threonine protein kinase
MFRGCGLFAYARRGGDLRKHGEMGAASSRVAPAQTVGLELVEDDSAAAARRLTWAEVEAATSGFTSRVIGRGGFSTVYLATLPSSNRLGAVKVHCSSERLHRAFRQELDLLLSLRHPHIVRLLGYCDDEEDEGALVFEYAPNGDLHHRLHGDALPWSRRVAVAFQIAQALEHLHEGRHPAVVHGDVKASNVLLDAAMDAKLCDFGFAHAGLSATVQRGCRPSARAVVGSPGYVDPQLLRSGGAATKKTDVYSFGVLLLELLTGREAVCRETGHRLTAAVGPKLSQGKVADVLDRRLGDKYDVSEAAVIAELAVQCISDDSPGLRPSMADVVRILQEKTAAPAPTVGSKSDSKTTC